MTGNTTRVLSVLVLLLTGRTSAQAQRAPTFDPERIFMVGSRSMNTGTSCAPPPV
jgi:hypothetical protein